MRSRYTAYATGHVAHLLATVAPEGPHGGQDPAALRRYVHAVAFEGLDVRSASEDGDRGEVTFFARLHHGEQDLSFGERSRFVRREGRWLYLDGDRLDGDRLDG
jgi:SEC-C motif domain protein